MSSLTVEFIFALGTETSIAHILNLNLSFGFAKSSAYRRSITPAPRFFSLLCGVEEFVIFSSETRWLWRRTLVWRAPQKWVVRDPDSL